MKLGVSFNVFDGVESLTKAVENIRQCVDHVNIVYQNTSNRLYPADPSWEKEILAIPTDKTVLYQPKFENIVVGRNIKPRQCHENEVTKRELGRQIAKEHGCTHYLSMDVDEFYRPAEVEQCRIDVETNRYDATACFIQEYVAQPTYRKKNLESFFVSFIHDINLHFIVDSRFFVYVDPTRRPQKAQNTFLFPPEKIVLHHMTNVRKNKNSLIKKYRSSSAHINFKGDIGKLVNDILRFQPDDTVEIVENEFKI
jgi:hypothetical protein